MSAFGDCIVLVRRVKSTDGKLQTAEFLDVCRQVLPIVGMYYHFIYYSTKILSFRIDFTIQFDKCDQELPCDPAPYGTLMLHLQSIIH